MADKIYISQITIGSSTYDLKDGEARQLIADIQAYSDYLGVTTTALTDGASTNPVSIGGEDVTAKKGNIVNYGAKEFIFNGTIWQEFGDLSALGALAYADTAEGDYTPAGTINAQTFTGDALTSTGSFTPAGEVAAPTFTGDELTSTGTYTPAGTVSRPTITVTPTEDTVYSITDVGTLPTMTVENEVLTFNAGTLPTKGVAQTVVASATAALDADPAFTGTQGNLSVTGTPTGTNSAPAFTGTAGSVSVTGTPEGSVSQATFTGTAATITVEAAD